MKNVLFTCVLLLCPIVVWAQTSQTAVFDADGKITESTVETFAGHGDSGFDKMVDWGLASSAASASNPVGLTDAALQLAYAEKILLRSHNEFSASTMFQLAIRAAANQGDQETLDRIVKGAKQYGLDEIANTAETSKELAGKSRAGMDGGGFQALEQLLTALSDEEKFLFSVSKNLVAISFDNPEELKSTRATLVANQGLAKAAKDYLLAEVDGRIKEFEALPQEERDVFVELASLSRQGQVIARYNGPPNKDGYPAEARGNYVIYADGKVERDVWTKIWGNAGTSHSTYVLVVTDWRNGAQRVIWATKREQSRGADFLKPRSERHESDYVYMPQAVADKIRTGKASVHLEVTAKGSPSTKYNTVPLAKKIGEKAALAVGDWFTGGVASQIYFIGRNL